VSDEERPIEAPPVDDPPEVEQTGQIVDEHHELAQATGPIGGETATFPAPTPTPPRQRPSELRRERKELWSRRQETVYHLGGLAVELGRRRMLPDGVMHLRANEVMEIDARVVTIDAQLAEIEEERRVRRPRGAAGAHAGPEIAGHCQSCGAPFQADAHFCYRCGARIAVPEPEVAAQDTAVIADETKPEEHG